MSNPESEEEIFYNIFQYPNNYKTLKIKDDETTEALKQLFNNNEWDLKIKAEELEEKNKIEHNNFYNSFLNNIHLLDYNKAPKFKSLLVDDFINYKLIKEGNTESTEKVYITYFNSWINNIFPRRKNDSTLDWIILNQNKVLLKLFDYRSKNNKLSTFRLDINVILKLLKIALGEDHEMVNKYKLLNKSLSLIIEMNEKNNILTTLEESKYIKYETLLKYREIIYNNWFEKYQNDKSQDRILRDYNIISLLFDLYLLFPPMRAEPMNLVIVNNADELDNYDEAIYIKNKNFIILSFKNKKKGHKPITFNLNDSVIKSFSENNVETLINNIIQSVKAYPRKYLFIDPYNKKYTEQTLQTILYNIIDEKHLGINSFRSSYVSYWFKKLNKNQMERVAFFMRTSVSNCMNYYYKQDMKYLNIIDDKSNEELIINIKKNKEDKIKKRDEKKQYFNNYYEKNKDDLLERARQNSKNTYGKRIARELNNGSMLYESVQQKTIDKWGIKFNDETKLFYSEI